jgi:hypothetical protein
MSDSDSWKKTKGLVTVFKVDRDELSVHKIGTAISLEVSLNQTLDFIEAVSFPIPLKLAADHWELVGLSDGAIGVRVL